MAKEFKQGMTRVVIKTGDLTEETADALINAANNEGWMGGGVAGALRRAGGKDIEDEAVSKGPVSVGDAWSTAAGRLRADYVIHAAVMAMDFKTDAEKIYKAMRATLAAADDLGVKTIAVPAFGTGVGRFPADKAALSMLKALRDHMAAGSSRIELVTFVLSGQEIYDKFAEAAEHLEDKGGDIR